MWDLAKPYYEQGRPMDIDHIKWMMNEANIICKNEKIDDSLLLPLCILHDVGYSEYSQSNYYSLDIRKAHMDAGAKIAKNILKKLKYDEEKTEKIVYYVSVHDNWAFGEVDLFEKNIILGVFKDLDFLWIATKKGFEAIRKTLKKTKEEMFEQIISEPSPIGGKKAFSTKTTKELYEKCLKELKKDF